MHDIVQEGMNVPSKKTRTGIAHCVTTHPSIKTGSTGSNKNPLDQPFTVPPARPPLKPLIVFVPLANEVRRLA